MAREGLYFLSCSSCAELGQNAVKLEERCSKLSADNSELEAAVDRLRTALSQMEQLKKDLQHKARLPICCPFPVSLSVSFGSFQKMDGNLCLVVDCTDDFGATVRVCEVCKSIRSKFVLN